MDAQLRQEIRFITTRLGNIVREQAGDKTFDHVEKLRAFAKAIRAQRDPGALRDKQKLVNRLALAEAGDIAHAFSLFFQLVNLCEERARIRHLEAASSPAQSLRRLFQDLKKARVPLAKVQACLDALDIEPVFTAHPTEAKRRATLRHLIQLNNTMDQPDQILETLWQTEEVRQRRIQPLQEVEKTVWFFHHTVFETIANFYATFAGELEEYYPGAKCPPAFLKFASWVGGDRDGNPFVTPELSLQTARLHRRQALDLYSRECDLLVAELSHASSSRSKRRRVSASDDPFQPNEVFRRELAQIRRKLRKGYRSSEQFVRDLERIQQGLLKQNAWRTARGHLARLISQARVFGFHLAELDFRDHSARLNEEKELLEQFRTIKKIQSENGPEAANHFILSMTRGAKDIRALLSLSRRARLRNIDLVPLFETIEDLDHAPGILRELWSDKKYRAHLQRRGNVQEVMVGYSDSNKDGGYLAANWFLHHAQKRIARLAGDMKVGLRFFHGKGGTIDRGGGASHRTLRAQPHAAHGNRLRITEQGEVISLKYSNPFIAQRNLEQLTSAVIAANCLHEPAPQSPSLSGWEKQMAALARLSFDFYQQLVYRTPEFQEYFWQATPVDLVEVMRIGSRPSRRQQSSDLRELRAIPWVFSWTQSRHLLSAWYGLGHALEGFAQSSGNGLNTLQEMYQRWPFFTQLLDNAELSLAKTDLHIAGQYASLVKSTAVRRKIFGMIEEEYERSVRMLLTVTNLRDLLDNQPVLKESIRLRNPYVDPLNYIQIRFLKQWRQSSAKPERLRLLLALTVNGIAFGMKSTG